MFADCVFCNLMYPDGCGTHGCDGSHVADTPILSRARLSFPKVLTLQTIEGDNATAGRCPVCNLKEFSCEIRVAAPYLDLT